MDKRIITHQWGNNPERNEYTSSNGFVISGGTYNRTVEFFNELAAEAKRDFPHLVDGDLHAFIITDSMYNKGFAGIRFSLPENSVKEGYRQGSRLDFDYA